MENTIIWFYKRSCVCCKKERNVVTVSFFFSFLTLSQFACLLYNAWRFLVCMLTFSLSYAKFSFPVFSYIFSLFFTTKGDNVEEEELRNVRHEPG